MNEKSTLPKNEIDAIWQLFKKFKKMIIGITFVFTLLAIVYALFIHKPVYSAIALVQIGKKNNALVEKSKIFELKFMNQYKVNSIPPQPLPRISKIKRINNPAGIVRLYAESYELKELKGYLENIIHNITIDHNETIVEYVKENNNSLILAKSNLEKNRKLLKHVQNNIKENEIKISSFTRDDQTLINMYLFKMLRDDMSIEPLSRKITTYTNQVRNYTRILSERNTFGTHIINEVIIFENPISVSIMMLIIIGFVVGLIFALLLAFFLGFWQERKK